MPDDSTNLTPLEAVVCHRDEEVAWDAPEPLDERFAGPPSDGQMTEAANEAFDCIDANHDGVIDKAEFVEAMSRQEKLCDEVQDDVQDEGKPGRGNRQGRRSSVQEVRSFRKEFISRLSQEQQEKARQRDQVQERLLNKAKGKLALNTGSVTREEPPTVSDTERVLLRAEAAVREEQKNRESAGTAAGGRAACSRTGPRSSTRGEADRPEGAEHPWVKRQGGCTISRSHDCVRIP